jgi:putative endonuclease
VRLFFNVILKHLQILNQKVRHIPVLLHFQPRNLRGYFFVMHYHIYIIYSHSLDKYYTGYTEDIALRINQHNLGISTFTAKASDWELKYSETFPTRESAMKRESAIKKKKSRKYIEWLISSAGERACLSR